MARNFDESSGDYLDAGNPAALNLTGDTVTLSAWIRLASINGEKVLAKWADDGPLYQYLLSVNTSNHVICAINTGGVVAVAESTTPMVVGVWYHIAGVYDGSELRVYCDGVEEGSTSKTGNMASTTAPVTIGAGSSGSGSEGPFDGDIGHCAIWDAPLAAGEVASLAAGVSPLKMHKDGALKFFAPLNGRDPEYDVVGGLSLTVNGSTKAEEPPIPNSVVAP